MLLLRQEQSFRLYALFNDVVSWQYHMATATDELMSAERRCNDNGGQKPEVLEVKPVTVSLCQPQISHGCV